MGFVAGLVLGFTLGALVLIFADAGDALTKLIDGYNQRKMFELELKRQFLTDRS